MSGQLALLVTDFWNPLGRRAAWIQRLLGTGILRRAAERFHPEIPLSKIRVPLKTHICSLVAASGLHPAGESYARLSVAFAQQSAWWSDRRDHDTLFTFCGAALEVMEREKVHGNRVILDQFDTGRELARTLSEESGRYKSLRASYPQYPDWYYDRLDEEWRLADQIVVNSEWTRLCLIRSGIPANKIVVIPLSVHAIQTLDQPKRWRGGRLRVLWLGRMCLGKGLMYAVEAARAVSRLPIDFTFVGSPAVDITRIDWPANCRVVGQVPRSSVPELYRSHEVFLFPTLNDGFGRVQIEAALHGMVIIATDRCGSVVEDNRSGYVVPVRSSQAIVDRLTTMLYRPDLIEEMSIAALKGALRFSDIHIWPMWNDVIAGRNDAGAVEARVRRQSHAPDSCCA